MRENTQKIGTAAKLHTRSQSKQRKHGWFKPDTKASLKENKGKYVYHNSTERHLRFLLLIFWYIADYLPLGRIWRMELSVRFSPSPAPFLTQSYINPGVWRKEGSGSANTTRASAGDAPHLPAPTASVAPFSASHRNTFLSVFSRQILYTSETKGLWQIPANVQ